MELKGLKECSTRAASLGLVSSFIERENKAMQWELSLAERKEVWQQLFSLLEGLTESGDRAQCLSAARILSRDRRGLDECVTESMISQLMQGAGIVEQVELAAEEEKPLQLESLKVLSNLIHQSRVVQAQCTKNGFLSKLFGKIEGQTHNSKSPGPTRMFDFRLLFLFTALCPEQRDIAKHNHKGVSILNEALESILKSKSSMPTPVLEDSECEIICEILKAVFNITVNSTVEDTKELSDVAVNVNRLARIGYKSEELKEKVINHSINVVTNMEDRPEVLSKLLKSTDLPPPAEADVLYSDCVMNTVTTFLALLDKRLSFTPPGSSLKEDITPVLSVLYNLSRGKRPARKYLKSVVLPPLKPGDLSSKPEEGDSLTSRLVALLTNTSSDISTMVAEFLFVLCKENSARLVKHTGWGNAAGLLAKRGLLGGGRGQGQACYSSDSDSDTEEFKEVRHSINPVTRVAEPEGERVKSVLEGMTEEQKEYEAVQLANMMDRLTSSGVIKPCRVGADGKPEPVEHVLQLIQGQGEGENSGSDEE